MNQRKAKREPLPRKLNLIIFIFPFTYLLDAKRYCFSVVVKKWLEFFIFLIVF